MTKMNQRNDDDDDIDIDIERQPVLVEDVSDDEGNNDEGNDILGSLPGSKRPTLHGLDRVLSARFDVAAGTGSSNTGNGSQQQQQQQAKSKSNNSNGNANYNDYLKAQRTMMKSQRNIVSRRSIALAERADADDQNRGNSDATPVTSNAQQQQQQQQQQGSSTAQLSVQPNMAALTFAAKLRKRQQATANAASNNNDSLPPKTLAALKAHGRRGSALNLVATSDEILKLLENIDEDGHFGGDDDDELESMLPFYSSPVQRQRWNEDQILPHVNWGDLFFDLFYVAAAYNLGVMLTSIMNEEHWLRGCIYYVGIFGPLWNTWEVSMFYSSRYTSVDYAHRLFEVIRYLFVSMAVLNVKGVELLGDPKSAETLLFTSAITCEGLMQLGLSGELYWRGLGDTKAIRDHTRTKVLCQQLPIVGVYLGAFVVSLVSFLQEKEDEGVDVYEDLGRRVLGADPVVDADHADDASYNKGASTTYGATNSYESSSYSEPLWKMADLPLTLTAIAYFLNIIFTVLRKNRVTSGKHGKLQERFVPSNTDYTIHRYGEWILLMIGEGILSLLIVETVEARDYYFVTVFGILTIIFIQILKFESEPSHAEGHALWSNFNNAMCYSYLIQVLSMGLIVFGVTYKVFLKGILKDMEKEEAAAVAHRLLGGASPSISDQVSATVFAISLLIVLLSLELMCLTHSGIREALEHLVIRSKGEIQKVTPHLPVVIIALFKVAILVFTMTLSLWTTEPAVLTLSGCCIVLAIAVTRVVNFFFIHKKGVIQNLTNTMRNTVGKATMSLPLANETGELANKATESVCKMAKAIVASNGTTQSQTNDEKKGEASVSTRSNTTFDTASDAEKKAEDNSESLSTKASDKSSAKDSGSISGEADLASGMNNSFDATIVANLNGGITQVNDTAVKLFGYATKKEMIGKNLNILVGGSDGKRHDGYVKAFKKRVTTQENLQHKVLGRQRMLHACRADGTEFPCIVGIKMIANNTKIAGFIRDMSSVVSQEKSKVDVTMSDDEAIQKVVDDHAFDAIIATNDQGVIQGVNVTAVTEFGYYSKNELIGDKLSALIRDAVPPNELFENHGSQRLLQLTRKDGSEFRSIVASTKIKGTSNMFVVFIRNIDLVKGDMMKFETSRSSD